jgi:hypothetical protein
MKKTLDDPTSRENIIARIEKLNAQCVRRWGKMSPHQTLCHLTDSYCAVIGEKTVSSKRLWLPAPVIKWFMLNTPWPRNVATRPEMDQLIGGTPPVEFEADRKNLLAAIERFTAAADSERASHPMAGVLNRQEWMRWGYLHADHHLRQFGL